MFLSFDYLEKEFPILAKFGQLTEVYCETDSNGALYKIREIGETITALIYKYDISPAKILSRITVSITKEFHPSNGV